MAQKRGKTAATSKSTVPDEPVYEGDFGRTALSPVHVTVPGGFVRSVRVYTSVNVTSDPELKEATLSGALHRFEGGEELAIPFIYHDTVERRFCLVVPEALRHRELEERAQLLAKLAAAREHAVPMYVRDARVVIGLKELEQYLAAPPGLTTSGLLERQEAITRSEKTQSQRKRDLDEREAKINDRETRLHSRAEEVTRREDDLRAQLEQIDAQRRDVELRERELELRFESLTQREASLSAAPASASKRPSSKPPPPPADARAGSSKPPPLISSLEDDVEDIEEIEDISELEPIGTNPDAVVAAAVLAADDEDVISADEVEEIIDEDEVEELDDADVVREVTGVTENPNGEEIVTDELRLEESSTQVESAEQLDAGAPVEPPDRFLDDEQVEMAVSATVADGVWVFVRVDADHKAAFDNRRDLLVQLAVVQGYPVVILALVSRGDGRPYVRRVALDPRDTDDRRVLDMLRRKFEATVAVFNDKGAFERTLDVDAARRVNVAMLLERVGRMSMADATIDAATAMERALAAPPPVREPDIPFQSEEPPPSENAREAAQALSQLSEWSAPEKLDRALFALSIPRDIVDGSMRRVLDDAVKHGLALPPPLVSRAVSVGVAPEPGALVSRQILQFRTVADSPEHGGLSEEEVAANWEALLEAATENEVAIDAATHEVAWRSIRHLRGESTGFSLNVAEVPLEKLPDMGSPELVLLLDHPKMRRLAALELCRRSDPELLETLYKSVRKMPRAEVVRVVPRIVEFGESAGDALIDGLTARKTFVRQASALGLGHLRLRRAVVPLLHLLQNEPSDIWKEVARILGEFGTAAFRTLSRALKDPKGNEEKLTWALAHMANHGCEQQVESLGSGKDKKAGVLALEALTLRQTAKNESRQVRGEIPVPEDAPIRQFSRRFYQELEGTAPEADLLD